MHLHQRSAHNETLPPITSTAVTLDFFLLYLTGGDDLRGDGHVHDLWLVCLFAGARVCHPPRPPPLSELNSCTLFVCRSWRTQYNGYSYDAGTIPVSFYTHTHTLINAPPPHPSCVWTVTQVRRVPGVERQPVGDNSRECQKWECRDSLTVFCGPHTYASTRGSHLSTWCGSTVNFHFGHVRQS